MCGGGGDNDALDYQRRQEQRRQRRVEEGMQDIENLFSRGYIDAGPRESVGEDQTLNMGDNAYFDSGGNKVTDKESARQLAQEGKLFSGAPQETAEGYDESFYQEQAESYEDYAMPQVNAQHESAKEALTFQLSRMGQLEGSLAADRRAGLDADRTRARREVKQRGQQMANDLRGDVADERARLTNLVQQTADPAAVSSQASEVASSIDRKADYDSLPQFFQNATAGLGNYQQGKRMGKANRRVSDSFASTKGGSGGSGRVVQ